MRTPEERLGDFLAFAGWSRNKLAEKTGTDPAFLYRILRGDRRPGLAFAVAIERITADWPDGPIRASEWVPASHSDPDPIPGAV